jgi:hypothetical protein
LRYECVLLGATRGRSVLDPEAGQVDVSDCEAQLVRPGFHERQSVRVLEASKPQTLEICAIDAVLVRCGDASIRATGMR